MIHVVEGVVLTPLERFGLEILLDASRVLRTDDAGVPATQLRIVAGDEPGSIEGLRAADWGLVLSSDELMISRGALRVMGRVAGLEAEARSDTADRHGRVPASVNPLVSEGFEREPVLSRAGARLRAGVAAAAGSRPYAEVPAWPRNRAWAVTLTHDVDVLAGWPAFTALRFAELLRKGEVGRAMHVVLAAMGAVGQRPPLAGIREVIAAEAAQGARSTWYFLCGQPSLTTWLRGDLTYRPEGKPMRAALELVQRAGGEIGLHGSFEAWLDAGRLAAERDRLAQISSNRVEGARQHFLRARPGRTHAAMERAGFGHDATMGFADRNGFRTGACDVLPAWNAEQQVPFNLQLVPLAWMDRALSKYHGVEEPARWIEDALQLANLVRDLGGLWCGLWHPNLTGPLGYPGAIAAYRALCAALASDAPWFCTVSEAVTWRTQRRSLRARGLSSDGTFQVTAPAGVTALELRDRTGRALPATLAGAA